MRVDPGRKRSGIRRRTGRETKRGKAPATVIQQRSRKKRTPHFRRNESQREYNASSVERSWWFSWCGSSSGSRSQLLQSPHWEGEEDREKQIYIYKSDDGD